MNYLTTSELSKKWNVSGRTIAYYCEAGRISGIIKKGKVWLIPEDAQRPIDKRRVTSAIITIDENIAEKGLSSIKNKVEADNPHNAYCPGDIYRHLGLTRETLRYYEKIGLIEPNRNIENLYREFDIYGVFHFLAIDFHKKRGFNLPEIKNLMKRSNQDDSSAILQKKVVALEQNIYKQQCTLNRLKETRDLYEYTRIRNGKFEIRDFPLYSVLKSFDDANDISNYGDAVLRELEGEDILSHLVRAITVDDTGYTGSKMCIVKKVTGEQQDRHGVFLESGRCMYTIIIESTENNSFSPEEMFRIAEKWETELGVEAKGIVYIFSRFIVLDGNIGRGIHEMWMPIK